MAKKSKNVAGTYDESDWQAESDLRTLVDAKKIQQDEKRLKAAMKKREEQMDALEQIKG